MPRKYPVLSGKAMIKALERLGYKQVGQRGSHVKLRRKYAEGEHTIVVPLHKELDRGTLAVSFTGRESISLRKRSWRQLSKKGELRALRIE